MVKRFLHTGLSALLALLLVFGSTSKEYLHLFTGHEDTVDCTHEGNHGLSFEKQHHHCEFLSFTLPPFLNDAAEYTFSYHKVYPRIYHTRLADNVVLRPVSSFYLRGPPAQVV